MRVVDRLLEAECSGLGSEKKGFGGAKRNETGAFGASLVSHLHYIMLTRSAIADNCIN